MAEPYIYKPQPDRGKPPVIILPNDTSTPPTITLSDGRVVAAVRADTKGFSYKGHEGYQWMFPREILGQENAILTVDGKTQELPTTNSSWRGGSIGSLTESSKGAVGDFTGGEIGGSGTVGGYGAVPDYIGDLFPKAVTTKYKNIKNAGDQYAFVNPLEFGRQFGIYQRNELAQNNAQARQFALDSMDTELQGLLNYVPRSAQLKREQTSQDNLFNQQQRTQQVLSAIPDVVSDVNAVAADARKYAAGEVPNSVVDKALALGTRSAAADVAASSGFGVGSSAARKLSDLMSAKDRIGLSQYGENLLSQNAAQRADLFLAPTQYSNAGEQINVAPTISGSQLQQSAFGDINNRSLVDPNTSMTSVINQNQQLVNWLDQTRRFNAQNRLQNDQFNANNLNNFALSFFNYLNSYANSVAGATQTAINTQIGLDQQDEANAAYGKEKRKTQNTNTVKDVVKGVATIGMSIFCDGNLKNIIGLRKGVLEKFKHLNVYDFTYIESSKAGDGHQPHIGVIAQDFVTLFPEAVGRDEEGCMMLKGNDLIGILLQAVKELNEKVAQLESK